MSEIDSHKTAEVTATRGKPFQPGEDPRRNLGGRPAAKEANALIASIWDEAVAESTRGEILIRKLFELTEVLDLDVRLRAIREILDRRLGKPIQSLNVDHGDMTIRVVYVDPTGERA